MSFFFFQAEDGIRDVAVTGVQTCALPISAGRRRQPHRADQRHRLLLRRETDRPGAESACPLAAEKPRQQRLLRSEERRVGEEGRSRGSPDHLKKKKKKK